MKREAQLPAIQTDKITLVEIVVLKCSVGGTEEYLENPVKPEQIIMHLGTESKFDFTNQTCRFRMHIILEGQTGQETPLGLNGEFLMDFVFQIENLSDFLVEDSDSTQVHSILGATLLGICFSTSRGIVLERTKGTPFAGFILPIINPLKTLFETAAVGEKRSSKPPASRKAKRT